jgi:hypothetical protein
VQEVLGRLFGAEMAFRLFRSGSTSIVPWIQIQFPSVDGRGDWLMPVLIVFSFIWLMTLGRVLSRREIDPITRLTWVVVVIFVPVFGMLLYWFIGPEFEAKKNPGALDGSAPPAGTPWERNPGYTLPKH